MSLRCALSGCLQRYLDRRSIDFVCFSVFPCSCSGCCYRVFSLPPLCPSERLSETAISFVSSSFLACTRALSFSAVSFLCFFAVSRTPLPPIRSVSVWVREGTGWIPLCLAKQRPLQRDPDPTLHRQKIGYVTQSPRSSRRPSRRTSCSMTTRTSCRCWCCCCWSFC
jgi:hypothetical protein